MLLIALTGGIASGKSSVAKEFGRLGAGILDADQLARDVVEPGQPALEAIKRRFGEDIVNEAGELKRSALADIIFSDPAARADLNAIVHPAIFQESQERLEEARKQGVPVTVYEIPLLVESKNSYDFDHVITVETTVEQQLERLMKIRNLSQTEAEKRLSSQATSQERISRADHVIDSSGTLEGTLQQVRDFWTEHISPSTPETVHTPSEA